MAGYQTMEALRPILHRGPPATPVVNRDLVRPVEAPKRRLRGPVPIDADVIAEIIARRERGESYGQIAAALHVSHGTIRVYSKHVAPPEGGWPNCWQTGLRQKRVFNVEFARRLRRSGFSYEEIARELKCSTWTAIKVIDPTRKKLNGKAPTSAMLRHVAAVTGFERPKLRKQDGYSTKVADLTKARHIAFWLLRTYRDLSYPAIGNSLGGYDHSTVIHGFRRADRIAKSLGLTADVKARKATHALWNADWREVGK